MLTAEGRRRLELFRLEAARRFEQRVPAAVIAAELRVSERSVQRRRAWQAGGEAGWSRAGRRRSAGSMSSNRPRWIGLASPPRARP